ncbi:MAG: LysM peptidoglycan-binding domain-containing protein [Clostridiales bacterium]|nr:LysM peptidoglycan-binding domain-containing protein [Clostridiales bacterium]
MLLLFKIPEAVKYVPYGFVIQNNNKYSWNKPSYSLWYGKLPDGMELKPNGELYGVPKETGEFTFGVQMRNSSGFSYDDYKDFTLEVKENTDANVDGATDTGYDLTDRIMAVPSSDGEQTLVSEGVYDEFTDIFLDGEKLVKGTDYKAESGSTRITIANQTLGNRDSGRHTLGIEFRTDDDTLKRAAQNYYLGTTSDDGNGDNNNDNNNTGNNGSGGSDSNTGNSGNSGGDSSSGSSSNTGSNVTGNTNSNTAGNGVNTSGTNATDTSNGAVVGAVNGGIGIGLTSDGTETVEPISYQVVAGDTLSGIALKYYGSSSYWQKIYADNASTISNPDRIYVGQIILIYPLTEQAQPAQGDAADTVTATGDDVANISPTGSDGGYTVKPGDTLWKIAKNQYGKGYRWRKIYDANSDQISDPGKIQVGQILRIPD